MKIVVDLTSGGSCTQCDRDKLCYLCGYADATGETLCYSQKGDHDHLVMNGNRLARESHGRFVCMPCNEKELCEKTAP